jgi:cytochrome c oxidase cbb3-type subunit 3
MANKLIKLLTRSTPIDQEQDILLDHDYDGIQELDNKLPPWWLYLFIITVIIGGVYLVRYHLIGDWSSSKEWEQEMATAQLSIEEYMKTQPDIMDENSVLLDESEIAMAEGMEIFNTNCAACHKVDGGGLIGPNLTDEYWIHGGDIKDLFKTIKYGVPEKGMISWKTQLKPEQMQAVASYILVKLQGTNPPDAKAPEGEKYVAESTQNGSEVDPAAEVEAGTSAE